MHATEPQIESGDEIVAQENSALQIHRSKLALDRPSLYLCNARCEHLPFVQMHRLSCNTIVITVDLRTGVQRSPLRSATEQRSIMYQVRTRQDMRNGSPALQVHSRRSFTSSVKLQHKSGHTGNLRAL
jgi:hypothetical protein